MEHSSDRLREFERDKQKDDRFVYTLAIGAAAFLLYLQCSGVNIAPAASIRIEPTPTNAPNPDLRSSQPLTRGRLSLLRAQII